MNGKRASKTRILISLFKKYKKTYRHRPILLLEDNQVISKDGGYYHPYIKGWSKRKALAKKEMPYERVKKTFYSKNAPYRFVYEIKEDYELSIH